MDIKRDNLTRTMKWMLADKLAKDNLAVVNKAEVDVVFTETLYSKYIKRIIDIIVSGIALIVFCPINIAVAIITFFDLGSPILFKQTRIGKNKKPFILIKFRNMTNEKDKHGQLLPPNQRVTKWGKIVRKTSIDELLNFWSILKGDMSIIGPRPLDIPYLSRFSNRHMARFLVRPGLECPPLHMGSNVRTWGEQFENDVWYVENISFQTDLKLLINLVKLTLNREYATLRGQAKRGDFLGYLPTGEVVSQYDIPEEYIKWLINEISYCDGIGHEQNEINLNSRGML